MRINLNQIVKLIGDNGISLVISAVFVWALIITVNYYRKKMFMKLENDKSDEECDLCHHIFFAKSNFWIKEIDYSLEITDNLPKCQLIQDIMVQKFRAARDNMLNFVEEVIDKQQRGIKYDIHKIHMKHFNKLLNDYSLVENYDTARDNEDALGVAIRKFNAWHKGRIDFIIEMSEDISSSKFYRSDHAKIASILDMYIGVYVSTLHDAKHTLHAINGSLSGKTYNGEEIK
jgi:hypothetical protein